jgi:hypothetical protein
MQCAGAKAISCQQEQPKALQPGSISVQRVC